MGVRGGIGVLCLGLCLLVPSCAHDINWMDRAEYTIVAVDAEERFFTVSGDHLSEFSENGRIQVDDSTGNDGVYTVASFVLFFGDTRITVVEPIPDETADGVITHVAEEEEEDYPTEVQLVYRVRGPLDPSVYYYMVFNFTAAPSTADATRPLDFISDRERGRNWELYVMLHRTQGGVDELYTLQRPRVPTILGTAAEPVDVAVANFNGDKVDGDPQGNDINDIAVACRGADSVQLLLGIQPDPYNPTYYEDTATIEAGTGERPLRLFAGELTGDEFDDLLVVYAGPAEEYAVTGVDTVDGVFTIDGNHAAEFQSDTQIEVSGSTGNDGLYTVVEAFQPAAGSTSIRVEETIPTTSADGQLSNPAFLRLLISDGAGGFTAGAEVAFEGSLVDAVLWDFNADFEGDLAVLTEGTEPDTAVLRVFLGDGTGLFAAGQIMELAADPAALAGGDLGEGAYDLVVANRGVGGANGSAIVLLGNEDGTFTAGDELEVEGSCTSVAVGKLMGSRDDVLVTYITDDGEGRVGVFQNEADAPFQTPADAISIAADQQLTVAPYHVVAHDTGGDGRVGAVIVDGAPGSGGATMYIQRGGRETNLENLQTEFAWETESITYLTGSEPCRIHVADLDQDGEMDFVIPNCGGDENGNSLSLFYGLGKHNYTSADIYWTDVPPGMLETADWYVSHAVGANFFELRIDPGLFYDLADLPPDADDGFIVDFMTGTTGIDLESNIDQLGEIRDHLDAPVQVKLEVGHYDDEQTSPRANTVIAPVPAEDIDDWRIEVF